MHQHIYEFQIRCSSCQTLVVLSSTPARQSPRDEVIARRLLNEILVDLGWLPTTSGAYCRFHAPDGVDVPERFWVRIRLAYAELSDGTIPDSGSEVSEKWIEAGLAHSTEDRRAMDEEKGGALFGEVEDYPVVRPRITKTPNTTEIPVHTVALED